MDKDTIDYESGMDTFEIKDAVDYEVYLMCLLPGLKSTIFNALMEKFPTLYELCEASEQDIYFALHGIASGKAHKVYKALTPDRKRFCIDVDDFTSGLLTYSNTIDEQKVKHIIESIRNLDDEKAIRAMLKIMQHLVEESRSEGYNDGYYDGEHSRGDYYD